MVSLPVEWPRLHLIWLAICYPLYHFIYLDYNMRVLLSIKPEFASKIFDGTKRFEFRRSIFKNPAIKSVVVYASSPTQKVIGEFEIKRIINTDVEALWLETKEHSGITEDYFMQYFTGKEQGFAIEIKKARKYAEPLCIKADFKTIPPQSFVYIN